MSMINTLVCAFLLQLFIITQDILIASTMLPAVIDFFHNLRFVFLPLFLGFFVLPLLLLLFLRLVLLLINLLLLRVLLLLLLLLSLLLNLLLGICSCLLARQAIADDFRFAFFVHMPFILHACQAYDTACEAPVARKRQKPLLPTERAEACEEFRSFVDALLILVDVGAGDLVRGRGRRGSTSEADVWTSEGPSANCEGQGPEHATGRAEALKEIRLEFSRLAGLIGAVAGTRGLACSLDRVPLLPSPVPLRAPPEGHRLRRRRLGRMLLRRLRHLRLLERRP
mmetsp:Transcript_12947/g.45940  ORF Transcript_12947/g.45940 Transcript_12947/m.45940 type:complete len:283 (+) Transcript_12947:1597-2445(+)